MLESKAKVQVLVAGFIVLVAPLLRAEQQYVYTFRYYSYSDGVTYDAATYVGPLINESLSGKATNGLTLNPGVDIWAIPPPFPITPQALQPCTITTEILHPYWDLGAFYCQGESVSSSYRFNFHVFFDGGFPTGPGEFLLWPLTSEAIQMWGEGWSAQSYLLDSWFQVSELPTYTCEGFHPPFDKQILLRSRTQRAIPLTAKLLDGTNPVSDTAIAGPPPIVEVLFSPIAGAGLDVTSELVPVGQASLGNVFTYDSIAETWRFNLGTSGFSSPGTYAVNMKSGDTQKYTVSPTCSGTFVRLD